MTISLVVHVTKFGRHMYGHAFSTSLNMPAFESAHKSSAPAAAGNGLEGVQEQADAQFWSTQTQLMQVSCPFRSCTA